MSCGWSGITTRSGRSLGGSEASAFSELLLGSRVKYENSMKTTTRKKKNISAESIARMADRGKDVSSFFTNSGQMRKPIQRVNIDFTANRS